MEKIVDALLTHNWTLETIIFFGFIFLVVPIKGESALKTILDHISNKKNQELKLIQVLQEQHLEKSKKIKEQDKEISILKSEREKDRAEMKEMRNLIEQLKSKLAILGG